MNNNQELHPLTVGDLITYGVIAFFCAICLVIGAAFLMNGGDDHLKLQIERGNLDSSP